LFSGGFMWCEEFEPEAAAFAGVGLDAGAAAHLLGGSPDDGQTDAGARKLLGRMEALEDAEDLSLGFRVDADAVVLDPDADAGRG
jgi:hypothetical protein